MKTIRTIALLLLCPLLMSGAVLSKQFTADTTVAGLQGEGWTVSADALADNSLTFSGAGMKLENTGGGAYYLRSPEFTSVAAGTAQLTLGTDASLTGTHGRFALVAGWGANNEVIRLILQQNNTTLRVVGDVELDLVVPNFNLAQGGQLLDITLEWDGEFVDIYLDGDLLTTVGYRNAGLSVDGFEFTAGWTTSSGTRAVASTGIVVNDFDDDDGEWEMPGAILSTQFNAGTTIEGLAAEGWGIILDNAAPANTLTFSDAGMQLTNDNGGTANLRSPVFAPQSVGSVSFTLGSDFGSTGNQGYFSLYNWATPAELTRLRLESSTQLRVYHGTEWDQFQAINFSALQPGELLDVVIEWDETAIYVTVNNDENLSVTASYFNSVVLPVDRFQFVAGWSSSTGVRDLQSDGITVVPGPSAYATSLRDLAEDRGVIIGTAVSWQMLSNFTSGSPQIPQQKRDILAAEFNGYVAENNHKMRSMLRNRPADPFNVQVSDINTFEIDRMVQIARSNGVSKIRGHALIWHEQIPDWLDSEAPGWSSSQITAFATSYIKALLTYCREHAPEIYEWDVINEAISDIPLIGGTFRSGTWYDGVQSKQAFIDALFIAAREADPDVRLVYNDYNIELSGGLYGYKNTRMRNMISGMVSRGVPVTGVGLQGHFVGPNQNGSGGFSTTDANRLRDTFTFLAGLGLECIITELDLSLNTDSPNSEGNVTAQQLAEQGVQYERIVATALAQPNAPAVFIWGYSDTNSWIPNHRPGSGHALLFDHNHQRKPAYFGVANALARNFFWDGSDAGGTGDAASDGGSASWNLSTANWDIGSGYPRISWRNRNEANAMFSGTAGTVTITENVSARSLLFESSGYVLTRSGSNTLTLIDSPDRSINVAPGVSAAISTPITGGSSGAQSLMIGGGGQLTLSGVNTYSGATHVNAGGLIVDGSIGSTSMVTVASGARIGGNGSLAGGVRLAEGAKYVFDMDATLTVSGTVTLSSGFSVNDLVSADGGATDWSHVENGSYTLIAGTVEGLDFRSPVTLPDGRTAFFQEGGLQLVVEGEAYDPNYLAWLGQFELSDGDGAFNADPDGDGFPNLFEFVFDGDPTVPFSANMPEAEFNANGELLFRFIRRTDAVEAVDLTFEYSTDLASWSSQSIPASSGGNVSIEADTPAEGLQTVTITVAPSAAPDGRLFGRIRGQP